MASTEPEIKDGFSLPVWMKTKPTREFEPFTTSPPAHEDSFFYIRYPKTNVLLGKPTTAAAQELKILEQARQLGTLAPVQERDWSKHTKPCQDVLHGISSMNTAASSVKPKPAGTDDGFKGEGAACGTSVVKVAHQMISSSRSMSQRGFAVAPTPADEPDGAAHARARRGSRSLPASPAHSPPAGRRAANRYFTSPFQPTEDQENSRSWLTTALLGLKKDFATSTSTLAEEDSLEVRLQGVSLAASAELLPPPAPAPAAPARAPHAFRPRPTELREMNFWSPTSM